MDIAKILIVVILAGAMVALAWWFLRRRRANLPVDKKYATSFQQSRQHYPEKKATAPPPPASMPASPAPMPPQQSERERKAEKEEEQSASLPAAPIPSEAMPIPEDEVELADWLAEDDTGEAYGGGAESPPEPDAEVDEAGLLEDVVRYRSATMPEPKPSTETAKPAAPAGRTEEAMQDSKSVHFSAYYPREVRPMDWQPLKAYLFRRFMADKVAEDAQAQLGERLPGFRKVMQVAAQPVAEGAMVTVTPELPGFQFNPPSMTVGFYKDMHRFDFELRATDAAPLHQATNGTITFTVDGLIVGDVPLSVFVGETADAPTMTSAETRLYQAIFCSYSHDDTTIVERVERAYKALGLDYLRDVMTLKAGQDWSAELLNLIERADVFQLFWSRTAAVSQHVRYEWEHALKVAPGREKFIRPVYWEQPMPATPPELSHIHFTYQPDLAK